MNESIQSTNGSSAHVRHAAPAHSRIANGGGAEEFQHRTVAHHRDVHDPHAPLRRSQRLRRAESSPGAGADLPPARDAGRRQGGRSYLLLHLRMVLPRQGTDHQIQPETRMDHGTRAAVLEPRTRGVLSRVRPGRSQYETHGEKRHAVEHGSVVVRHRLRHLPDATSLPGQGIEGARPRIPPRAGRDRTGHLGIDQLHSGSAVADKQCFRLHLRVHPHFRLQVAYDAVPPSRSG